MSPAASRFIHLARWVAAFLVVLHHVAAAFVSVPDIMTAPHGPHAHLVWFLAPYAFAHEAVVVFFVLSGFLVGGAVVARRDEPRPWLRPYFIDRLTRIYVVLVPVLALTALLDGTGRRWFGDLGLYDMPPLTDRYAPGLIVPNLLSLQGLWFDPLGSNVALWTLGMEVWFYVLFPLLLLPWLRAYPRRLVRVLGLAAAILFLLSLPPGNYMPFGFCVWGLGVLARRLPRPLLRSKWLALILFLAVSVAIRLAVRDHYMQNDFIRTVVDANEALLFANLLLTLRFDEGPGFALARWRGHEALAGFSFTLYALHVPVLFWLANLSERLFGKGWRLHPATPLHYLCFVGAIGLCVLSAWALSRVTEARTNDLRRVLQGLFAAETTEAGVASSESAPKR